MKFTARLVTVSLVIVLCFVTFFNYNTVLREARTFRSRWGESSSTSTVQHRPHFDEYKAENLALDIWNTSSGKDRILAQIAFVPNSLRQQIAQGSLIKHKTIFVEGFTDIAVGRAIFLEQNCSVSYCSLSRSLGKIGAVDAVVYGDTAYAMRGQKKPNQIWIFNLLESPQNAGYIQDDLKHLFNWTATYRRDSTIVTPYGKWVPGHPDTWTPIHKMRDFSSGKTKLVAWFVSNCDPMNDRHTYAAMLGKHIKVDIYGACGTMNCPRYENHCEKLLKQHYKFYFSSENSNCRDYITEKFFENALANDVIPIVMGARPEDYREIAPPKSFIHVDDFESPGKLAEYLHILDNNSTLYNEYFHWRRMNGKFINTKFWCRLCSLLHETRPPTFIEDVHKWWNTPGVCTTGRWPKKVKKPRNNTYTMLGVYETPIPVIHGLP